MGVGAEVSARATPTAGAVSRERMIEKLIARGITDARVLDAIRALPRHQFVAEALAAKAYSDNALPIGEKQTISQPWVVARMSELAEVGEDDRVLEVGTGSGYQAAVLSRLARHVYSVERLPSLARRAQQVLSDLSISNVSVKVFDGTYGWGEWAPYPVIVVTAASDQAPPPILEQLAEGGRLVIPLGDENEQVLVRIRRTPSGFEPEEFETVSFVPLLGRYGRR
jgi:protein-L-isoaspartate(D-aspartate) O-methyltransferase